ncbi:hypothetical protein PR048_003178 [Dryococelus australis]|uniref:Uncharacterized protein n=1 Tax=Dryococelus australis TaxID=614101 RepID=A0ABQ9IMA0_9NEOP|nr:hypothetical protein PR048_003178 [Dryococelus australis]
MICFSSGAKKGQENKVEGVVASAEGAQGYSFELLQLSQRLDADGTVAECGNNCLLISCELWNRVTSEPDFLQRVITRDETWLFEYDHTTKRQSPERRISQLPLPKKAQICNLSVKSVLMVYYYYYYSYKEFDPPRRIMNLTFYLQVLGRLKKLGVRIGGETAYTLFVHENVQITHLQQ